MKAWAFWYLVVIWVYNNNQDEEIEFPWQTCPYDEHSDEHRISCDALSVYLTLYDDDDDVWTVLSLRWLPVSRLQKAWAALPVDLLHWGPTCVNVSSSARLCCLFLFAVCWLNISNSSGGGEGAAAGLRAAGQRLPAEPAAVCWDLCTEQTRGMNCVSFIFNVVFVLTVVGFLSALELLRWLLKCGWLLPFLKIFDY